MSIAKITQPGWENYTGELGGAQFVNGVSVDELDSRQINRIGANLRIETMDGEQLTPHTHVFQEQAVEQSAVHEDSVVESDGPEVVVIGAQGVVTAEGVYTREQLEALADKGGIAEIRKVSDLLGVKGKSISSLINGILDKTS